MPAIFGFVGAAAASVLCHLLCRLSCTEALLRLDVRYARDEEKRTERDAWEVADEERSAWRQH